MNAFDKNYTDKKSNFWLQHGHFILLLGVGLALRVLFIQFQGLSNDELSAWFRATEYQTWNSFWYYGIEAGDMHPAFYQVFLWGWMQLFGDSEWAIRFPSLLFYAANSWLIYRIGLRFFTKENALVFLLFYSCLAFPIIHTVFARPYNSGTFFVLLSVWALFNYKNRGKIYSPFLLLLGIGFLGAMLSHYFAFLVVGILGVSSLFYVDSKQRIGIILTGIAAILLFLPHLSVTWFHLNVGGLGWVDPPKWSWFFEKAFLFLNESYLLVTGVILLILFFRIQKVAAFKNDENLFLLGNFFLVSGAAFLISIFITPILREDVLLFYACFLSFYLFKGVAQLSIKRFNLLFWSMLLLFSASSIWQGNLLKPRNFGVFREIGNEINQFVELYPTEKIEFATSSSNVAYINYYLKSPIQEEINDWANASTVYELAKRAKLSDADYFVYSWTNHFHVPMYYEVIRKEFPYVVLHQSYFNSAFTIFSKKATLNPWKKTLLTKGIENKFMRETSSKAPFINGIKIPLSEYPLEKNEEAYFYFEAENQNEIRKTLYLVAVLERDGEILKNENGDLAYYLAYDQLQLENSAKTAYFSAAVQYPNSYQKGDQLHLYFWNPEEQALEFKRPKIYRVAQEY